ncbi:MAG: thioredoxin family protein [Chlamydiota bacterium]
MAQTGSEPVTSVQEFDEENFFDKIDEGVVIVDFYAPWCHPCNAFAVVYEEVAEELGGTMVFGKIQVANAREISQQYNIGGIPTVIVFVDGQEVKRHMGYMNTEDFKNFLLNQ